MALKSNSIPKQEPFTQKIVKGSCFRIGDIAQ